MRIAAALTAVVMLAVAGCTSSTTGHGTVGGPIIRIECVAGTGNAGRDKTIVTERLNSLGADVVGVDVKDATVTMRVRGVVAEDVAPVCIRGELTLRGLIAPVADASVDCARPDTTTPPATPLEACDTTGQRYQFGPAIVSPADLITAEAIVPGSNAQWIVAMTLSSAAKTRFGRYTTAHNTSGASGGTGAATCSATTVPCADYLGFVLDGVAISVPLTLGPITGGTLQIAGSLTRVSARLLASQLSSGPLPVLLRLVSVK